MVPRKARGKPCGSRTNFKKPASAGFSAPAPDEGASNDSESDAGESLNRDCASMTCKQYIYYTASDEVNKNTGLYIASYIRS